MAKAIFLDRDGVINKEVQFVARPEEFHLLPNTIEALKLLNKTDYKLIIITNQSGMGYGYYTEENYNAVTDKMLKLFAEEGIRIDDIFYCPHRYEEECNCRKPNTGMLKKAKAKYDIDFSQSWLIGDKTSDIKAGENIGAKTILVLTGAGGKDSRYDIKPDYVAADLLEAAYFILEK
ncbi:D-glycero-beta-D-manno-heptose 1,7-bisphosphate 7-phosphatase [Candidatus Woesearchaeota archaeon]|nr:MAG: D-glycero-beta-D-manno-heptose 1,7-bisphosphate 7-phosphatase [Candidatus Woesearchaeota archaeon]